jgi:serine/threonine protein kinase
MKMYPVSLKDWRINQRGTWQDNLPVYLTIYKDVLKAVQLLHQNNVTHYDIKADNILLDYRGLINGGDNNIRVVLGDFGEC